MPNHAVTAAGEAMPAGNILGHLTELLKAGDAQGALSMLSTMGDSKEERPVDKVNRLGWELAHALNDYGDGMFRAVIYPTSVRSEFAVGFCVLNLPTIPDPLANTIQAYRDGFIKFAAIPDEQLTVANEETLVMETYGVHLNTLEAWDRPALTLQGALAALKLAQDRDMYDGFLLDPLLRAVGGYLESLQESAPLAPPQTENRLSRIKAQIADLSDHDELHQLFNALMTIGNVLSDVGQHPKFWADRAGSEYTLSGKVLDELSDAFDFIIDDVVNRAKELPAPTGHDRAMKALTLGAWEVFSGSEPKEIIAALAPLATDPH